MPGPHDGSGFPAMSKAYLEKLASRKLRLCGTLGQRQSHLDGKFVEEKLCKTLLLRRNMLIRQKVGLVRML